MRTIYTATPSKDNNKRTWSLFGYACSYCGSVGKSSESIEEHQVQCHRNSQLVQIFNELRVKFPDAQVSELREASFLKINNILGPSVNDRIVVSKADGFAVFTKTVGPKERQNSREQVKCPHCSAVGGKTAMNRWHFDKCKDKNK